MYTDSARRRPLGRTILHVAIVLSLAFGTLYAEAQRRYLESVSPYARRLFDKMAVPDVDAIDGLPPAVALQQQRGGATTRSSVGTVTTLSNLLRMLYSRAGDYPPRQPLLHAEGFTAVLGTNTEQTYERYLRVGEHPRVTTALDSVVGPKNTAMGVGYFVTSRNHWYVDHPDGSSELVATMLFRVLKFVPKDRG